MQGHEGERGNDGKGKERYILSCNQYNVSRQQMKQGGIPQRKLLLRLVGGQSYSDPREWRVRGVSKV